MPARYPRGQGRNAIKRQEVKNSFRAAENSYRRLRDTLTNEDDYEKAGEFYINEMRMKRKQFALSGGLTNRAKSIFNRFYELSCGYGERPKRVVFNALLIILLFSFFFCLMDGIRKKGTAQATFLILTTSISLL